MSKIELKPCPFCGGEAEIKAGFLVEPRLKAKLSLKKIFHKNSYKYFLEQDYLIKCKSCGYETREFLVSVEIEPSNLSLKNAIESDPTFQYYVKSWNRRAGDEQREAD